MRGGARWAEPLPVGKWLDIVVRLGANTVTGRRHIRLDEISVNFDEAMLLEELDAVMEENLDLCVDYDVLQDHEANHHHAHQNLHDC